MKEPEILPIGSGLGVMDLDGKEYLVDHQHCIGGPDGIPSLPGDQWKILVGDSLMMSVIRKPGSYGYSKGLFEISFLDPQSSRTSRIFESEWLDTVLGYLTEAEVLDWLVKAEEA